MLAPVRPSSFTAANWASETFPTRLEEGLRERYRLSLRGRSNGPTGSAQSPPGDRFARFVEIDVNEPLIDERVHGVAIKDADVDALKKDMMTVPAHAERGGAEDTRGHGLHLMALANSPQVPAGKNPLEDANFDIRAAVQYGGGARLQASKGVYHMAGQELDVSPQEYRLLATCLRHDRRAEPGMTGGLLTRAAMPPRRHQASRTQTW
jgi:hypothetical protein